MCPQPGACRKPYASPTIHTKQLAGGSPQAMLYAQQSQCRRSAGAASSVPARHRRCCTRLSPSRALPHATAQNVVAPVTCRAPWMAASAALMSAVPDAAVSVRELSVRSLALFMWIARTPCDAPPPLASLRSSAFALAPVSSKTSASRSRLMTLPGAQERALESERPRRRW